MDDQFDKDLRNRIREVFDNFEDPSADEGWLQLRKKFPEEEAKRRPVAWLWWAAAAMLFLFLGIGVWMYSQNNQPQKFTANNTKQNTPENIASVKSRPDTNKKTTPSRTENTSKTNSGSIASTASNAPKTPAGAGKHAPAAGVNAIISNGKTDNKIRLAKTANHNKRAISNSTAQQFATTTVVKNHAATQAVQKPNQATDNLPQQQLAATPGINKPNQTAATTKANPDAGKPPVQQLAANTPANSPTPATSAVKPKQQAKSINDMFAESKDDKIEKTDASLGKAHFGVYAATYFNYAKGSSNNSNLGAGVTAEIKLNKHLTLVTGLTVAQNSLNFNTGIPTSSAQSNFTILAAPAAANGLVAASLPNAPIALSAAYNVNNPVTVASAPAFKNYDANLVGLDVPLNLKYDFNPKKYDFYVLAGVSSGTFINETYTYQYNYPALFSPSLQQIQDETSRKNFDGFYFAKTLNLAVGVGYPLGKNQLILEPFLKYPLDGLGAQNIRFGAGGINLKFNFLSSKK